MPTDAPEHKKRKSRAEKEAVAAGTSPTERKKDAVVEDAAAPSVEIDKKDKKDKKKKKVIEAQAIEADIEAEVPVEAVAEEGKQKKRKAKAMAGVEEFSDRVSNLVQETKTGAGDGEKKKKKRKKFVAEHAQAVVSASVTEQQAEKPKKRKVKGEDEAVTKAKAKAGKEAQLVKATEELLKVKAAEEAERAAEAARGVKEKDKADKAKAKVDKKAQKAKADIILTVGADDIPTSIQVEKQPKMPKDTPKSSAPTKSKKAAALRPKSPSPDPEPSQSDDDSAAEDQQDVHLYGFSTDEDSSDDDMDADEVGVDLGSIPTIARDDVTVKRRLDKARRQPIADRGVVYLGRIPHGFYEDQMKAYFSQFGDVTRLRLSRSKKTGRSKHYGFIEFESVSVAQIVAETMDNYLLMGHILTCKVIPKDEVHPSLWMGANRKWHAVPNDRLVRVKHNKPRTPEEQQAVVDRLLRRQQARKRKLVDAGIDYDFDAIAYKKSKAVAAGGA